MFGATCLVFLLLSCGGGGGDSETGSPSGSGQIMLTLQIDESQTETFGLKQTGAEFDCVGNHIDTIEILVLDASGNVIAEGGPFNCVDGTATLSAVAAGRDYTVQVNALDQEGFTIFSGEVTGVTVLANRVDAVGHRHSPAGDEPEAADYAGPSAIKRFRRANRSFSRSPPRIRMRPIPLPTRPAIFPRGRIRPGDPRVFMDAGISGMQGVYPGHVPGGG